MDRRHTVVLLLALSIWPTVISCAAPQRLGTISGVVVAKNGGGAACANCTHPVRSQVRFLSNGVMLRTVTTAANGTFSVKLPSGRYVVQTSSRCAAPSRRVELAPGRTVDLRLLCFNASG